MSTKFTLNSIHSVLHRNQTSSIRHFSMNLQFVIRQIINVMHLQRIPIDSENRETKQKKKHVKSSLSLSHVERSIHATALLIFRIKICIEKKCITTVNGTILNVCTAIFKCIAQASKISVGLCVLVGFYWP